MVDVITTASLLTALGVIIGVAFKTVKWFIKQDDQDANIKELQHENAIICYALSACLDGLEQLGANNNIPLAKEKLDKHLNKRAHHLKDE